MPNQKPTANDYGVLIDVSAQVRGPRGASKSFEEGLLLLLAGLTLDDQACVVMHPDYLVPRSAFPATEAGKELCKNSRQALGARLKTHHEELMRRGDLPAGTRLSINWAPDTAGDIANRPQASLKRKA